MGLFFLSTLLLNLFSLLSFSQAPYIPPDYHGDPVSSAYHYYENLGQIRDFSGNTFPDVHFYTVGAVPEVYLGDETISYVIYAEGDTATVPDTAYRIDMGFICGSGPEVFCGSMSAYQQTDEHLNYYTQHTTSGIANVNGYERIIYENIWPYVDMQYYSNVWGLKNYLIVRPGGDPTDIALGFTGQDSINITTTGTLRLFLDGRTVEFPHAIAYQPDAQGQPALLPWTPSYTNTNGVVSVTTGTYDNTKPLIIQLGTPSAQTTNGIDNLHWSTYFGGSGPDEFTDVKTDDAGNVYAVGTTGSQTFPNIEGTNTHFDNKDFFVVKFDKDGKHLFHTYVGGSDDEDDPALAVTANGNKVYAVGNSFSSDFFTKSSGTEFVDILNPNRDAVIFEIGGTLGDIKWSTLFGEGTASQQTFAEDVAIHSNGDVFMVGSAFHPNLPFPNPNQAGAYVETLNTGGFVARFGADRKLKWSTYFDVNRIKTCAFDGNDRLVIAGDKNGTGSFPFTFPTGSFQQSTNNGGWDGFVARFDATQDLEYATLFGGVGADGFSQVAIDGSNNIFLSGDSDDDTSFPTQDAGNGAFFEGNFQGGTSTGFFTSDATFTKLNSNLALEHATFLGGANGDFSLHVATDSDGRVYMSGATDGSLPFSNPNLSGGYTQTTHADGGTGNGKNDGFFYGFETDLENFWTSYFGGSSFLATGGFDAINGLNVFQNKTLYLVGSTTSDLNFQTCDLGGGAYFKGNKSSSTDGFIVRFDVWLPVGMAEIPADQLSVQVYPNPSTDFVFLETMTQERIQEVVLMDRAGKMVRRESMSSNTSPVRLDLSEVPAGVYLLSVIFADRVVGQPIVISK